MTRDVPRMGFDVPITRNVTRNIKIGVAAIVALFVAFLAVIL